MSDLASVVRQSRAGLITLATTITVGGLAYWGVTGLEQNVALELSTFQTREAGENAKLNEKDAELGFLKSNFTRFETLRGSGLAGNADREGWAETLSKVHKNKALPDTLVYTLLVPAPVPGVEPSPTVAPAQAHDMTLSLDSIHEGELFEFLTSYEQQVRGKFRVQSCQLWSPSSNGLNASCTLRFFNQPLTPPAAAPST